MNANEVWLYQKNKKGKKRPVFIHDYTYLSNGRLSNFVDFSYIKKDGTVSTRMMGYYFFRENFLKKLRATVKIMINMHEKKTITVHIEE